MDKVEFKQEKSAATWQRALGQLPNPHALQSWTWGEFKSRWGWQKIPLLLTSAQNSGEPLAAALLLKRKIPRTPFSILYVPKGPILDYNDGPLRRQVLAQLEKVARQERAILIKIDPDVVKAWGEEQERPFPSGQQFIQELKERGWLFANEQIQFRNTVELGLAPSEEELLMGMKQKTRYNIRYAGRKGITVREGSPADFDTILEMYQATADRDGFTIRPPDYYRDAWTSFYEAGMAQPLLAEFEGEPVAAVILVKFGDKAIYMYGASTEKERQRMPNYLLQWEAIRWAKTQGCRTYDFWGAPDEFVESDPLWGVWRFKSGFEGEVVHHIGAWDYPVRPLLYKLYSQLLPRYVEWLRNR